MYKQNPHRMKDLGLITETLVRSGFEHLTDWSSDKSHQKKGVSNQVVQATKKIFRLGNNNVFPEKNQPIVEEHVSLREGCFIHMCGTD